jgi:hypothetical protein
MVGRVSAYVGGRLLTIGLIAGVLGLALLVFSGIDLWLVVTRGKVGKDVIPLLVGGILAFALLSLGNSASKAGYGYLSGKRALARDVGRLIARRIERRRARRGGRQG